MASIAIGLEELLRMPLPTLQAVLQAGVESKRLAGQLRITHSGCWVTHRSTGECFDYAEFNSAVGQPEVAPGMRRARRYRLYQVAAVINIKRSFPHLTGDELVAWASRAEGTPEASHLCRYAVFEGVENPDGSDYVLTFANECKPCFNPMHTLLEVPLANRVRIACGAGPSCSHIPPCMMVDDPRGGFEPPAGEPDVDAAVQSIVPQV